MVTKPYLVLATYHPKVLPADKWNKSQGWRCWKIGEDLTKITEDMGFKPHADPKHGPQLWCPWSDEKLHAEVKKWGMQDGKGVSWHQDGDTTPGSEMNCALILWSSDVHTEFRVGDKVFQPNPFELVIAHNLHCVHRTPEKVPEVRYFFRQRVKVPTHVKLP